MRTERRQQASPAETIKTSFRQRALERQRLMTLSEEHRASGPLTFGPLRALLAFRCAKDNQCMISECSPCQAMKRPTKLLVITRLHREKGTGQYSLPAEFMNMDRKEDNILKYC